MTALRMRAARPRLEAKIVVVAAAAVNGEVHIESDAPDTVRLLAGRPLHLRFRYRLREDSKAQEEYTFRLRSHAQGSRPEPAQVRWGDLWGYPDEVWGFVGQQHVFQEPGEYWLEFEAYAGYHVRPWGESEDRFAEERRHNGRIRVVVSRPSGDS